MPFTFSHPAIVLPLTYIPKRWVSLTGLVIGSMTPDFEYFLRMRVQTQYSHTVGGLFWFDLPLGVLLAFVFHNIVRNPLNNNLPTFLKSRFTAFNPFDWNGYCKHNWLVVSISILIGSASHLFWDSFTHPHGYFVQAIPALTTTVDIFQLQVPIFKILQHGSTLVGALVIGFAVLKLPADNDTVGQFNLKYWSLSAGLTLVTVALRLIGGLDYKSYGDVIVTILSAGLISLVLIPVFSWQKG